MTLLSSLYLPGFRYEEAPSPGKKKKKKAHSPKPLFVQRQFEPHNPF